MELTETSLSRAQYPSLPCQLHHNCTRTAQKITIKSTGLATRFKTNICYTRFSFRPFHFTTSACWCNITTGTYYGGRSLAPQYTASSTRRAPGLIIDLLKSFDRLPYEAEPYAQSMWKLHIY